MKFDPIAALNSIKEESNDLFSGRLRKQAIETIAETIATSIDKNPACCTVAVWVPYAHLDIAVKALDAKGFTVAPPVHNMASKAGDYGVALTIKW